MAAAIIVLLSRDISLCCKIGVDFMRLSRDGVGARRGFDHARSESCSGVVERIVMGDV